MGTGKAFLVECPSTRQKTVSFLSVMCCAALEGRVGCERRRRMKKINKETRLQGVGFKGKVKMARRRENGGKGDDGSKKRGGGEKQTEQSRTRAWEL
jgi:hypothetical protein